MRRSVIWIVLVLGLLLFDPGFQCPDSGSGDACPISFMPSAYAQFTDVCPENGCPEVLEIQQPAPTATVLYEHPDNQYYPFPFNPLAGPGVESYTTVLTAEPYQNPGMSNEEVDAWMEHRMRIRKEIEFLDREAFYTYQAIQDKKPAAAFMSDIIDYEIPPDLVGQFPRQQTQLSSGQNIDATYYQDYINWLRSRADILEADIAAAPPGLVLESWSIKLSNARSSLSSLLHFLGDAINDAGFGPGGWFGTSLGIVTMPLDILGTMLLLENTDLNLPYGYSIGDAIVNNRGELQDRADDIEDIWSQIEGQINDAYSDLNTGGLEYGPCYPYFWWAWQGGDVFLAVLEDQAQESARNVVPDQELEENFALRYADWQLGGINAQSKATVFAMFAIINGLKYQVNGAGAQCIEGFQPIPDSAPSTLWNPNGA